MALKHYIPNITYKSIFEIDFLAYYEQGFRLILLDIDNTIIKYDQALADTDTLKLLESIKTLGFEVILISNNNRKRISLVMEQTKLKGVWFALKPLKKGFKKALKIATKDYPINEVINIGDQIMTDVKGGEKIGFFTILVHPIERGTDTRSTRINRFFERKIIKKIKSKYPALYEQRLKDYEEM